jgi:hypothetical protein
MRKILLFTFASFWTFSASAQLRLDLDGNVSVGNCQPLTNARLNVGASTQPSTQKYGICSDLATSSGVFNIGLGSVTFSSTASTSGRTIGVQGVAGNLGVNYGVIGVLLGTKNGAGVFGTLTSTTGLSSISGQYAGYFEGAVHVTGNLTAPTLLVPSDNRLQENITSLASEAKTPGEMLDNLMSVSVIKYNYIDQQIEESDTSQVVNQRNSQEKQMHYGLSAQELRELYPDLVCEGQDGYLGVNYIELVPVLIRSIQELKQELDIVKGGDDNATMSRSASATAVSEAKAVGNILYQNTPNPFKEQTTIQFQLADKARNAAICIFDMTGKMLKKLPVSSGETSVSINSWELGEGLFLYTLMVNGREIDTKRMLIKK